ncbi:hypothetical protein SDC9_183628 [bioreactor metagenome]|uniref:Exo-beta-D-glucosaminidase Ig-fold domain-containing protein n=1 Tax=bioreactor metagenome TaxID=1076179 RepID=A0A645HCM2_9ZZZZ
MEINARWNIAPRGKRKVATVTLTNPSDKIAFFIEMRVTGQDRETVLPVVWSDNYISLLPNETRTFEAVFTSDEADDKLAITYKGFNVK